MKKTIEKRLTEIEERLCDIERWLDPDNDVFEAIEGRLDYLEERLKEVSDE
jgi:tetrahydromethanopterin S-methyltransferase subunit G